MSMPRAVRHINETRAIQELFREGPMSRAELGRRLSLTRSTAGSIVMQLADQGLVTEGAALESGDSRIGRPGLLVSLRGDHAHFLGAEIGVDRLRILALDLAGETVWRSSFPYDEGSEPDGALRMLERAVAAFRSEYRADARIDGLCVTVPGLLGLNGSVLSTPILGWTNTDAKRLFGALKGVGEVMVENDANAFAIAETYLTGKGGNGTSLFIFMDSGVGGGLVSEGRLVRGQHGFAGEVGHIPIGEQGYAAGSVVPGSLESYVGKEALLARIRHHGGSARDVGELAYKARNGDAAARATVADWARWLARGLAMLVATLDPGRIVLGGACAGLAELCGSEIEAHLSTMLLKGRPLPSIEVSEFGQEVVSLGAACMLHQAYFSIDSNFVFGASTAA
jgi:predicted NBD/HSP70 family sugar kinase